MMSLYEIVNLLKKHQTMDFDKASPLHPKARGIPVPTKGECSACKSCEEFCPTKAIQVKSETEIRLDYGSCLHCGLCVELCEEANLQNSGLNYSFSFHKEELIINFKNADFEVQDFPIPENVKRFQELTHKRGFNYREVAASGNVGVECELSASFNNVFDSEGQMVRNVASPKHADAVVFSGPIGKNMEGPLHTAWECMPEPKALVAAGTEAISGGVYTKGKEPKTPDLFISGDPPRPDVMINAFRYLMGKLKYSFQQSLKERLKTMKPDPSIK
ncbi:MAG: 4Fe-4S dicluster domain-containing protein [Leptospiraceae bacterium]|nr:4Fe-4S dicluster domain-containing protein [Leptospiraceae bacterium]MCP5502361.1 4Fe-4S dicluster domain-containing protein [Leptospiraceae bacterium]